MTTPRDDIAGLIERLRIAELERDTAITDGNDRIEDLHKEIAALSARVKELEAEVEAMYTSLDANWTTHQRVVAAEARATRLQQERDEAYERAARTAHHWSIASNIRLHAGEMTAQEMRTSQAIACGIEAAIRQLATGNEKGEK